MLRAESAPRRQFPGIIDCSRFDLEVLSSVHGVEIWMSHETGAEIFFDLLKYVKRTNRPDLDADLSRRLKQVSLLISRPLTNGLDMVLRFSPGEVALAYTKGMLKGVAILNQETLNERLGKLAPILRRGFGLSEEEQVLLGKKEAELDVMFS